MNFSNERHHFLIFIFISIVTHAFFYNFLFFIIFIRVSKTNSDIFHRSHKIIDSFNSHEIFILFFVNDTHRRFANTINFKSKFSCINFHILP